MGKVALPFNDLRNNVKKPIEGYRDKPISLGDKIRNKRLELQLLQKDVADLIGVSLDTLTYWENNRNQPQIHHYLKVIEFLGYFPFEIDTTTLRGKIMEYRFRNGLSHKNIGKLLKVDGSTICHWEKNVSIPQKQHLKRLLELIS